MTTNSLETGVGMVPCRIYRPAMDLVAALRVLQVVLQDLANLLRPHCPTMLVTGALVNPDPPRLRSQRALRSSVVDPALGARMAVRLAPRTLRRRGPLAASSSLAYHLSRQADLAVCVDEVRWALPGIHLAPAMKATGGGLVLLVKVHLVCDRVVLSVSTL